MHRFVPLLCLAVAAVIVPARAAGAHDTRQIGAMTVSVGWRDEPAFAGLPNAVQVNAVNGRGEPVVDLKAGLNATISFGDATVVKPLLPGTPGAYLAQLVPTRPGTYSFHVVGTLDDQSIDIESTCSDTTFECVADAGEVEFPPESDGGSGTGVTAVSNDEGGSGSSDVLAIAALALSLVAVGTTGTLLIRSRRAGRAA